MAGAHGLRGELRVRVLGDGPGNLAEAESLWLAEGPETPSPALYRVRSTGSGRKGEVRVGLDGIADRDRAAELRGRFVLLAEEQLAPLEEGEFYWHELVGCQVETAQGDVVGCVRELWETGGHDVLVVEGDDGAQHLVPTARELMTEVDLERRRIVIDAIPGLLS